MTRTKDVGLSCSLYMIPLFIKERSATALQHTTITTTENHNTGRPTNAIVDGERLESTHPHIHTQYGQGFGPGPGDEWRTTQESLGTHWTRKRFGKADRMTCLLRFAGSLLGADYDSATRGIMEIGFGGHDGAAVRSRQFGSRELGKALI